MIPGSIKDVIDTSVMRPVMGTGAVYQPLILDATKASLSSIESMFSQFSNFMVKVTLLSTGSQELQYAVQLTNAKESLSLILKVSTTQTDVMNYLNSLVEKQTNGTAGNNNNDSTNGTNQNNNATTTPSTSASSTTTTTKPVTGYSLIGWMSLGGISTLLGFTTFTKRTKREKK